MSLCKFRSWMRSSSVSEVRFVVLALGLSAGGDIKARYSETTTVKGADQDRREAPSLIRFGCVYWTVNQAASPKPTCSKSQPPVMYLCASCSHGIPTIGAGTQVCTLYFAVECTLRIWTFRVEPRNCKQGPRTEARCTNVGFMLVARMLLA